MATTYIVRCKLSELMYLLPPSEEYLFRNYSWKDAGIDLAEITFENKDFMEASALYHKLWKLRLPSLWRNWM